MVWHIFAPVSSFTALARVVQAGHGAAAAAVAIGLFAGLRPSEIRDLKSEDILKDKIRVTGGKLRRQLKRSTPIPQVLAEWLKEFPFKGLPPGWDGKMKRLKKATKAKKWVQDIIRHTSITFQTERDKNEALCDVRNHGARDTCWHAEIDSLPAESGG